MSKEEVFKNVKIHEKMHTKIKTISIETGINVGKLVEMGEQKIIDDYNNGSFDNLKDMYTHIRRDGTFIRT